MSGSSKPRLTYRLAMMQERAFNPRVYQGKVFRTVFDSGQVAVEGRAEVPGTLRHDLRRPLPRQGASWKLWFTAPR